VPSSRAVTTLRFSTIVMYILQSATRSTNPFVDSHVQVRLSGIDSQWNRLGNRVSQLEQGSRVITVREQTSILGVNLGQQITTCRLRHTNISIAPTAKVACWSFLPRRLSTHPTCLIMSAISQRLTNAGTYSYFWIWNYGTSLDSEMSQIFLRATSHH
jgi:hypothetical protein